MVGYIPTYLASPLKLDVVTQCTWKGRKLISLTRTTGCVGQLLLQPFQVYVFPLASVSDLVVFAGQVRIAQDVWRGAGV